MMMKSSCLNLKINLQRCSQVLILIIRYYYYYYHYLYHYYLFSKATWSITTNLVNTKLVSFGWDYTDYSVLGTKIQSGDKKHTRNLNWKRIKPLRQQKAIWHYDNRKQSGAGTARAVPSVPPGEPQPTDWYYCHIRMKQPNARNLLPMHLFPLWAQPCPWPHCSPATSPTAACGAAGVPAAWGCMAPRRGFSLSNREKDFLCSASGIAVFVVFSLWLYPLWLFLVLNLITSHFCTTELNKLLIQPLSWIYPDHFEFICSVPLYLLYPPFPFLCHWQI